MELYGQCVGPYGPHMRSHKRFLVLPILKDPTRNQTQVYSS